MKFIFVVLLTALLGGLCQPAWAIYKCVGPDKKLTYQDQACQASSVAIDMGDMGGLIPKSAAEADKYPPGTPGAAAAGQTSLPRAGVPLAGVAPVLPAGSREAAQAAAQAAIDAVRGAKAANEAANAAIQAALLRQRASSP